MAGLIVTNNATSLLQSAITAGQTTLTVAAADAALFPAPAAGDWFPVTLVEGTKLEICRCTARAGAVLTVTRAQESTIAQAFGINAQVDHRLTMAAIQTFLQDAPSDGSTYGRKNAAWATTIAEAPNDANAYVRSALAWVVGYTKAAIDTLLAAKIGDAAERRQRLRAGRALAWVLGYTKSATDTLLAAKAPTANPTFTGTVTGAAATFSTTLSVTGLMTATGGVSLPTVGTGVQFPTPGMSIVGRATSVGWNSAANGSGTDVMALTPAGILSFGSAGGVSLPSNGVLTMAGVAVATQNEFLQASNTTYVPPATLKALEVECQAPGGKGGSSVSTGASTVSVGQSGGGGAYGRRVLTRAEIGASIAITVNLAASSGGTTTLVCAGTGGTMTCNGGSNGGNGTAATQVAQQGQTGGAVAGFTLNIPGGTADVSYAGYLSGPGGLRGKGGGSVLGQGGPAIFTSGSSAGADGTGFGGGGTGGGSGFSGASQVGGNGTAGFLKLREFF
jgi:hypothetical protein